ncbi:MAG TPA: sulfotransferase [bacterium]|nr:sulfotransferase [bacterium]
MKPNFFIIGAPRCGTTALSQYLSQHPNVFFSDPKEPHYFDFDFHHSKMEKSTYMSLFDKADPARHLAIGEGSTNYLHSECAVPEILKFNQEAKFIVMLRNPIDLVQSRHSYGLFVGEENIRDFEEAWRAEADRREGRRIPLATSEKKFLYYHDFGKIGQKIDVLFSRVDRAKVKVILLEDMIEDPKQVYEDVLTFLGLPSDGRTHFPKINENRQVQSIPLQRIYSLIEMAAIRFKSLIGWKGRSGILAFFFNRNIRFEQRDPISDEFKAELKEFYREDVQKLEKLLERDLSHWGF